MGMNHTDNIVDLDVKCTINVETKKIETKSPKNSFAQYDHNAERIGFTMARNVEGHDMSTVDRIAIKYLNVSKADMYIVDDLAISEDGEHVTFTWLVSGNATKEVGSLIFVINFRCWDDSGAITYNWTTHPCSTYSIFKGVPSMDSNPDELYDFWARYNGLVKDTTESVDILQEKANYLANDTIELEKTYKVMESTSEDLAVVVADMKYRVPTLEGKANVLNDLIDVLEDKIDTFDRTLADNQVYVINQEISEIDHAIDEIAIEHRSINLLNMNDEDCVQYKFLATNGIFTDHDTYFVTPYIKVEQGQIIAATFNDGFENTMLRFVTAYSAAKEVMTNSGANSVLEYLVPEGVMYIRISILKRDDFYNYMVYVKTSDEIPNYEEYYEPYHTLRTVIDTTLTKEGESADAKVVGDELTKLQARIPSIKNPSMSKRVDELSAATVLSIDEFPEMLKTGQRFSVSAKFNSFDDGDSVKMGFINDAYGTYQGYLELTANRVKWHLSTVKTIVDEAHGLELSEYFNVIVMISPNTARLKIVINTIGGVYTFDQTTDSTRCNAIGTLSVVSSMDMSDVVLSGTCSQFKCNTWLIGDSYFGYGRERVIGRLMDWGLADGVLISGLGGLNSKLGYSELQRLLTFGTPKYLVWYLGMNDDSSIINEYYPLVEELCDRNSIELIFNRIPLIPTRLNENSAVNEYVINSGRRYIDSYDAVGADVDGNWFEQHLGDDGVHPSEFGAAALASRLLIDIPEILS